MYSCQRHNFGQVAGGNGIDMSGLSDALAEDLQGWQDRQAEE
jgi:hypothetical protein